MTGLVVPVDLEAEVTRPGPVNGKLISGGKRSKEMIGVLFGKIFDAEIVHSKGECGATGGVAPETWGVTDGVVAIWS